MLKRWTVSPLYDVNAINQRQEAVQDLVKNKAFFKLLTDTLASVPDVERMLTRIFTYSVKNKVKAFYIDA